MIIILFFGATYRPIDGYVFLNSYFTFDGSGLNNGDDKLILLIDVDSSSNVKDFVAVELEGQNSYILNEKGSDAPNDQNIVFYSFFYDFDYVIVAVSDKDKDGDYDDFSVGFEITHYPFYDANQFVTKTTYSRIEFGDSSSTDMIFYVWAVKLDARVRYVAGYEYRTVYNYIFTEVYGR